MGQELSRAVVDGWESRELEKEFEEWDASPNLSGRDTHHVQQVAILLALVNGHRKITSADWRFAKEIMRHQNAIRRVFKPSEAENTPSARLNERIMETFKNQTEKALAKGVPKKRCYITWKTYANNNRWYKFGVDVEKTIDALVRGGALVYEVVTETKRVRNKESGEWDEKEVEIANKKKVMLATLAAEIAAEKQQEGAG